MKKILFLTFYYSPDLSAGSFRNTSLSEKIIEMSNHNILLDVFTTQPNRYSSYKVDIDNIEKNNNLNITRIEIPKHTSGFIDQIRTFKHFFFEVIRLTKNKNYDLVYASSSRLFTAFLGYYVSKKLNCKLYLDIRDIFYETILDVLDKNPIKYLIALPIRFIEHLTFNRASHINLISKGFESYFKKFNIKSISYYSNGIDNQFLDDRSTPKFRKTNLITYAGNIGESQALHKIIPQAAKKLNHFKFKIIGDGSAKKKLVNEITRLNLKNVEIINPINRLDLIKVYNSSQFSFIHLKNKSAFLRVLPSKVFELGALNTPIIAGVSGYSRKFISENLPNSIIFNPHNSDEMTKKVLEYDFPKIDSEDFKIKFSRQKINTEMTKSILNTL